MESRKHCCRANGCTAAPALASHGRAGRAPWPRRKDGRACNKRQAPDQRAPAVTPRTLPFAARFFIFGLLGGRLVAASVRKLPRSAPSARQPRRTSSDPYFGVRARDGRLRALWAGSRHRLDMPERSWTVHANAEGRRGKHKHDDGYFMLYFYSTANATRQLKSCPAIHLSASCRRSTERTGNYSYTCCRSTLKYDISSLSFMSTDVLIKQIQEVLFSAVQASQAVLAASVAT